MDSRFLFDHARAHNRSAGALGVSLVVHAAIFAVAIWLGARPALIPSASVSKITPIDDIVWLDVGGPGGGGGGGGNKSIEPPRIAQLKGDDTRTVAVKPREADQPQDAPEPDPVQNLVIPAQTLASADTALLGAAEGIPPTTSRGSGSGPGAGSGTGTGSGPGTGAGLGPGKGMGTGDGVYGLGSGIETPVPLSAPKPEYTTLAMRAKIQGRVLLQCIVQPDGTVGDVKVLRSLDSTFGLDQEAVKAARSWLFRPGMRLGRPVAVLITIEMAFTLR